MAPQAHDRGLVAIDSMGLFATEATPYTAETFAAGDYLRMEGSPVFIPYNDADDLGQTLGSFDRGEIAPGSFYAGFSGTGLLRRAVDVDDGPDEPYAAILKGAGFAQAAVVATSNTFTRSIDPAVWEAARYSARLDFHGVQRTMFGCLTDSITYSYQPGKSVRYGFAGRGLVSGTFATFEPAEDNPASRTPAVSFAAGQAAPPFVFQGATIQYSGSSALKVESMQISIQNSVVPVMSGNATFGVDGVLLVDRIFTASLQIRRPLQAVKKFAEEYLWNQNNALAGAALIVTLASGSRGLVQTLSAMHQTGYPGDAIVDGVRYVTLNLRGTATCTQAYT